LIDPRPYQGLERVPCEAGVAAPNCVVPRVDESGQLLVDDTLLAQRAAFLRPNSQVAIVMLTDENDCSLQPVAQSWVVVSINEPTPMFRGTSACDANPNDKCCRACGVPAPAGCSDDPICATGLVPGRLPAEADGGNLRCFEQRRRFGYDYLYPTQRYVNALTQRELCLDQPDLSTPGCPSALVPNPLFAGGRGPDQVLLAGIVGVPWQSIAAGLDRNGRPLSDPAQQLRFKSSSELTDADWARIAGSPGALGQGASAGVPEVVSVPPVPPSEPTMVETPLQRANVNTGNPINGRDYDTTGGRIAPDDLQYACIFPLSPPRDCLQVDPSLQGCDCFETSVDRPLCESTPGNGSPGSTQYWAKAYPGLRHLQVLQGLGEAAVVSSICARNTTNEERPDFGYRPAMTAIIERLQSQLGAP
jgi:hypothetical protein